MAVLLLELWFDYRKDFVAWAEQSKGLKRLLYRILTLGVTDTSEESVRFDERAGRFITVVGIPSAFLLHGYVGFIFGSIKANPWWGTVLMPIIFIFSAMVSGIALVLFLYVVVSKIQKVALDMKCLEAIGKFLFYALVIDAAIESLDWIHRLYEAEESIDVLVLLASGKLYYSLGLAQVTLGTIVPLAILGWMQVVSNRPTERVRTALYFLCSLLIMNGVLAMRWNVVIGGQLFSKSLRGFTTYKLEVAGHEGLFMAIVLLIAPFFILWGLAKIFMPGTPGEENKPLAAAKPG
jgi:Ni/Fe-hydrogenase subunit HybB-like protein